jgi:hypothetical protein
LSPPEAPNPDPQEVAKEGPPFDPLPRQEKTRTWLAFSLLGLLAFISIALIFLTAFGPLKEGETKDLVAGILSPLVALTGAALGFYFGGHHGK